MFFFSSCCGRKYEIVKKKKAIEKKRETVMVPNPVYKSNTDSLKKAISCFFPSQNLGI